MDEKMKTWAYFYIEHMAKNNDFLERCWDRL